MKKVYLMKHLLFILALIISFSGCGKKIPTDKIVSLNPSDEANTGRAIKPNEKILVNFTCRFNDRSIAMTTDQSIAEDESEKKSGIFLPLKEYGPIPMTAGSGTKGPDYGKLKCFENEVLEKLSLFAVGMKPGEPKTILITAEDNKNLSDHDRYLRLSYVKKQKKEIRISAVAFKRQYGIDPEPGLEIKSDDIKGASFKILSCDEKNVFIRLSVEEGMRLKTPAGMATMHNRGDYLETVIDIRKGDLRRSGVIVGKVTDIDEEKKIYTTDYINPFGNESLVCDVEVNKMLPDNKK